MKFRQFTARAFVVLMALFVWVAPAWAAQCSDVYSSTNGINSDLQASGNTLDLSGVSWANNAWPSSGTTLPSGDYFFRTESLDNNYQLNIADGARVRIFVNGSQAFAQNVEINNDGSANQLLLVTREGLSIGNNAKINGLIYSAGAISVGNNSEITGGLAAAGAIGIGNTNPVADYSGVSSGLLNGLCESGATGPVELSVNGDNVGPIEVDVDDNTVFSGFASGCPAPGALSSQQWRETWRINGSQVERTNFSSSSCDRSPVDKVESFGSEGTYIVSWTVEFRSCFLGVLCGNWEEYGEDSIVVEVVDDEPLICFSDDFFANELSESDWVTSVKSGNFTPQVVDGRLRMTEAVSNQSTAATLQREIPGAENLVVLEFDYYAYGGSGADGIAVVLSDAAITPQPGSFGGSLGYAQRNNGDSGFAGGWLGIGIDEYGNFSASSEGRAGGSEDGRTRDSVAIRGSGSGTEGYRYLDGTGTLDPGIDETGQNNTHRYRITVDSRVSGQAVVSVERNTGNGFNELISPFNVLNKDGQADVPENFLLSLTGSTGGSTNIHELDNLELCALKLNEIDDQVDHFEISHDGEALTCRPETIQIRACANADCDELYTDPVKVTMNPDGWLEGSTFTFSGGVTTKELQVTQKGPVELGVQGSEPSTVAFSQTLCNNGSGSLATDQCTLDIRESGFDITVDDHVSATDQTAIIEALEADSENPEKCVPAFDEGAQKDIQLWATYVNPNIINKSIVVGNDVELEDSKADAKTIELEFNGGVATLPLFYSDVGEMSLNALYMSTDPEDADFGLEMEGQGNFVTRPDRFELSIRTLDGAQNPAAESANGPVFVKAGESFEIQVAALNAKKEVREVTPNFGRETSPESVELTVSQEAPLRSDYIESDEGYDLPQLEGTFGAFGEDCEGNLAPGTACGDEFQWQEVGIISIMPSLESGSYLGTADVVGDEAPYVGRFIPHNLVVEGVNDGDIQMTCGGSDGFTYSDQETGWVDAFSPLIKITATRNADGAESVNYRYGDFMRLEPGHVGMEEDMPAHDSSAKLNNDGGPYPVEYVRKVGQIVNKDRGSRQSGDEVFYEFSYEDSIRYTKSLDAKIEPFKPSLNFEITTIEDADLTPQDLDPHVEIKPGSDGKIYYGRLVMENVYGPETEGTILSMPFSVEYFEGSRFKRNVIDDNGLDPSSSCTVWNAAQVEVKDPPGSDSPLKTEGEGDFVEGEALLELEADGTPETYTLEWDLSVLPWLRHYWGYEDAAVDVDEPQNPRATATFGVYRGNDRIIYWREVQN